jgi:L-threonylcarbamoyladenylate synthase
MIRLTVGSDPNAIATAARAISAGKIVAIPTDTLYGLAVDPFQADAVKRVFAVKGRAAEQALPLIGADAGQIEHQLGGLGVVGRLLADRFWPGPLTLIIRLQATLPRNVTRTGTIAVRVPAHPAARELCRVSRGPVTATSANISGAPASADPDEVVRSLGAAIDVMLDAGPTPGGPASTIVDITGAAPRLVRAGAVAWEEIQACVDRGRR